jgi:hypothetical protein
VDLERRLSDVIQGIVFATLGKPGRARGGLFL